METGMYLCMRPSTRIRCTCAHTKRKCTSAQGYAYTRMQRVLVRSLGNRSHAPWRHCCFRTVFRILVDRKKDAGDRKTFSSELGPRAGRVALQNGYPYHGALFPAYFHTTFLSGRAWHAMLGISERRSAGHGIATHAGGDLFWQ